MKRLILLRHAKASSDEPKLTDIQRPLTEEGKRDVQFVGQRLRTKALMLDGLISSPAKRAVMTADIMAEFIEFDKANIQNDDRIYENTLARLLDIVYELDDAWENVMLVGHNPGFSLLANHLCNTSLDIPSCGVCSIQAQVDSWHDIQAGAVQLEWSDQPA